MTFQDVPREDRWLFAWVGALAMIGVLLIAINAFRFHYTGISYFPRPAIAIIFPLVELIAFALTARGLSPRTAFVIRNYFSFLLLAAAISVMTTGIQYTPFRSIDGFIARWDQWLGVSVVEVMAWTWAHPWLRRLMQISYPALNLEVFLIPLLGDLFQDRRRTRVFLYAIAYSYLAGGLFYYFFPSSGPASLLASPHFSWEQRLTSLKFHQVHHRQEVTTVLGGMVAFPSFHAVWALLLTYAAAADRRLFSFAAAINGLVILSTVLLGWHFLADIAASAFLAGLALLAGQRTHARLCRSETPGT